jgi:hypothetical protein
MRWLASVSLFVGLGVAGCSSKPASACDDCVNLGLYCNPTTFQCMSPTADLSSGPTGNPPDMTATVGDMSMPSNDDM